MLKRLLLVFSPRPRTDDPSAVSAYSASESFLERLNRDVSECNSLLRDQGLPEVGRSEFIRAAIMRARDEFRMNPRAVHDLNKRDS